MSDTPETDAAVNASGGDWSPVLRVVAQRLERQRDEAKEELRQWQTLCLWGGTPEHVHDFIKGQQTRIHEAQDIEETCEQLERERDEAREIAHDLAVIASHCLGSHSFSLSETSERIADTLKRWRSTQPCKK
jgi:hypothetical protein